MGYELMKTQYDQSLQQNKQIIDGFNELKDLKIRAEDNYRNLEKKYDEIQRENEDLINENYQLKKRLKESGRNSTSGTGNALWVLVFKI